MSGFWTGLWIGIGIGGAGFGALAWLCKEPLTRWYKGAERFVGDLEDQVRSLKARLR